MRDNRSIRKRVKFLTALGKRDEAVPLLRDAIDGTVDEHEKLRLRLNLCNTFTHFGDWQSADNVLKEIDDWSLLDDEWLNWSSFCAYWIEDFHTAEWRAQLFVERHPTDPDGLAMLGAAHIALGQYAAARDDYLKGHALSEDSVSCSLSASALLASCIDDDVRDGVEALRLLESEKKLVKDDWKLFAAKAAAYAELGRFSEAIEHAVKACLIAPMWERETRRQRLQTLIEKKPFRLTAADYVRSYRREIENWLRFR